MYEARGPAGLFGFLSFLGGAISFWFTEGSYSSYFMLLGIGLMCIDNSHQVNNESKD